MATDEDTIFREVQNDSNFVHSTDLYHDTMNKISCLNNAEDLKYALKVHSREADTGENELVRHFAKKAIISQNFSADSPRCIADADPFFDEVTKDTHIGNSCDSASCKTPDTFYASYGSEDNDPRDLLNYEKREEEFDHKKSCHGHRSDTDDNNKSAFINKTFPFENEEVQEKFDEFLLGRKNDERGTECFVPRSPKKESRAKPPRFFRDPSPIHERLAMTKTKSATLRQESSGKQREEIHNNRCRVPFYCTVANSSCESVLTSDFTVTSSTVSSSSSEHSCKEKTGRVSRPPSSRTRYIRASEAPCQDRIKEAMKIVRTASPFHDRLASVETKSGLLRRQTEKAERKNNTSNSGSRSRPAFYAMTIGLTRQSSYRNESPVARRVSSTPIRSGVPPSRCTSSPSKKNLGLLGDAEMQKTWGKLNSLQTNTLYSRLARQDTIASSKRILPTPGRHIMLSPYEQVKLAKNSMVEGRNKSKKTSSDFFDKLSKDQTFSTFSKSQIVGLPTDTSYSEY